MLDITKDLLKDYYGITDRVIELANISLSDIQGVLEKID